MTTTTPSPADESLTEVGLSLPFHMREAAESEPSWGFPFWDKAIGLSPDVSSLPEVPDDWRPVFCIFDEAPVYLTPTGWLVMTPWPEFVEAGLAPAYRAWPAGQKPALLYLAYQDLAGVVDRVSSPPDEPTLSEDEVFLHNAKMLGASADEAAGSQKLYRDVLLMLGDRDWAALGGIPQAHPEGLGAFYEIGIEDIGAASHERFLLPIEMHRLRAMGREVGAPDSPLTNVAKPFAKYMVVGLPEHRSWLDVAFEVDRFWRYFGLCPDHFEALVRQGGILGKNVDSFVGFSYATYLEAAYPDF